MYITYHSVLPVLLQTVSVFGAGGFLLLSRSHPAALVPAIICIALAVFFSWYSRWKLISILLLGILTSLILALRFEFLPWGDPWFEYGMVQRIITFQSIDPSIYPSQLPVLHLIIALISTLSEFNSLVVLKFLAPLISVIGLYAVFRFTQEISSEETAFFAALLLLSGTPWLHWTTQGVRESLGIALAALILYTAFRAIRWQEIEYLVLSLVLTCGLVLVHDLSFALFIFTWIALSFTYLLFICESTKLRVSALYAFIIAAGGFICMVMWSYGKTIYGYSQLLALANAVTHSSQGILVCIACLIFLFLIPVIRPEMTERLRSLAYRIMVRRDQIYVLIVAISLIGSAIAIWFILGKSSFVLTYPLPMLFNGLCMIILSIIGVYYFLETGRFPILAWAAVLVLVLVFSMIGIVPFVDPLRILEFLYIPLAIIAGFGLGFVYHRVKRKSVVFPVLLTVFIVVNIITAFPAMVFFGEVYPSSHPLYDTRSLVIGHDKSEVVAISWINTTIPSGIVHTDVYAGYAARGLITRDTLAIDKENPFTERGAMSVQPGSGQRQVILILARMTKYMEFGSQWQKEKRPLTRKEYQEIRKENSLVYDNGAARIFAAQGELMTGSSSRCC